MLSSFVKNLNDCSEEDMLLILGIDREKLHDTLLPVCDEVMKLFFYMKTGKLLAEKDRIQNLRQIMPGIEIHEYKKGKLETSTLLKMLVGILEYFSSHPYFLFDNLENIPYFVDPDVHFYVTFNHENCAFELYANIDITMKNYEIIKFDFTFQFHLSQLVIFTKNEDLSLVGVNTNETHPPFYHVNQIMFFLLINESFVIKLRSL